MSTSKYPPPVLTRVDEEARASSWYFGDNVDGAHRHVQGRADGAFAVAARPGDDQALDLHYMFNGMPNSSRIVSAPRGLHLTGMSQYFPNLSDLIANSEVDASCLGVLLYADAPAASAGARAKLPGRLSMMEDTRPSGGDTDEHVGQAWYLEDMAKERALELIEFEPQGAFIVRDSSSEPGCYALSYSFSGRVQHKLVETIFTGVRFRGSTEIFSSLSRLIDNYMRTPSSELKCLLVPPRPQAVVLDNRQKRLAANALEARRTSTLGRTTTAGATGKPSWDCRALTREQAMDKLNGAPMGSFVVRPSDKSFAALSMVSPSGLYHMHIESDHRGIFFRKCTEFFPDLFGLVEFYSTTRQTDLPVPLTSTR